MIVDLSKEKDLLLYINDALIPDVISCSVEMQTDNNVVSYKSNMNEVLAGSTWEGSTKSKAYFIKIIQNANDFSQITDLGFTLTMFVGERLRSFSNCYLKDLQIKFDDEGKLVKISTICGEE